MSTRSRCARRRRPPRLRHDGDALRAADAHPAQRAVEPDENCEEQERSAS
jgi:hypothetical protein